MCARLFERPLGFNNISVCAIIKKVIGVTSPSPLYAFMQFLTLFSLRVFMFCFRLLRRPTPWSVLIKTLTFRPYGEIIFTVLTGEVAKVEPFGVHWVYLVSLKRSKGDSESDSCGLSPEIRQNN